MNSGKLIVFEGLDGSGKSTQSQLLVKNLNQLQKKSFLSVKPTHFLIGGLIRSRLAGDWTCTSDCLQSLFLADHLFSLEKEIQPRLKEGINVISDRYFYSTYAYGALDCDKEWLITMNKNLPIPDLTIFLDLSVDKCLNRIKKERLSTELYEQYDKLAKIRSNYFDAFKIFSSTNVLIIDADRPVDEITYDIHEAVMQLLLHDYENDCIM